MRMSLFRLGWIATIAVSLVLGVSAAWAQTAAGITGSWQGTVETGKNPRILVKVSRAGDAGWSGVLYLLDSDMGYEGHNTTSMSVEGGVVRFTIVPIDLRYEGKLNADGMSMVGMFTQGSGEPH